MLGVQTYEVDVKLAPVNMGPWNFDSDNLQRINNYGKPKLQTCWQLKVKIHILFYGDN
jgi:hypothetical protein